MGKAEKEKKESGNGNGEMELMDMEEQKPMTFREKWKDFPLTVFCVFGSEFTERFSYFAMTAVLPLYFINVCGYTDVAAVTVNSTFQTVALVLPILGAIMADGYLGKFHTILWFSFLHMGGSIVLAVSSYFKKGNANHPGLDFAALAMIAVGTGCIKASVAPFGGDQFKPGQEEFITVFFSIFYFMINLGAGLSTIVTPRLRLLKCLGEDSCYTAAFGMPAALMILTLMVFLAGIRGYKRVPAETNPVLETIKTIVIAVYNIITMKKSEVERSTWVERRLDSHDCAKQKRCDKENGFCWTERFVNDVKGMGRIVLMFISIPLYWAIYQQGQQCWFIQSLGMKTYIPGLDFNWLPDQMQAFNAVMILILIPIFTSGIYPLVQRCGIATTPLRKMCVGGLVMPFAFFVSAWVQTYVNPAFPSLPDSHSANVYFFNNLDCNTTISFPFHPSLSPYNISKGNYTLVKGVLKNDNSPNLTTVTYSGCGSDNSNFTAKIDYHKAYVFSVFATGKNFSNDTLLQKSESGKGHFSLGFTYTTAKPYVDSHHNVTQFAWCLSSSTMGDRTNPCPKESSFMTNTTFMHSSEWLDMPPGNWSLFYRRPDPGDWYFTGVYFNEPGEGSINLVIMNGTNAPKEFHSLEVAPRNKQQILWQVPQWFILTVSEILFSITGLELAYTQAPVTMKSVLQAFWLATMAVGSVIAVSYENLTAEYNQVIVMALTGAGFYVCFAIFIIQAYFYKYSEYLLQGDMDDDNSSHEETQQSKI